MLGVIIGSGCIVLVVTVTLLGKGYILTQIEASGSNLVYASIMRSNNPSPLTLSDEISLGDMEAVKTQIPQVTVAGGAAELPMSVVAAGVELPVNLVGVTDGFQQIRRLVVFRGRYFDPDDMITHAKVCLLTQELAERVFPNQNPVGQEIRVGDLRFAVIGVFHERISTFGQSEIVRESVLIPFGLMTYYKGREYISTLYVQADLPEAVPEVTRQVAQILKSRHRPGTEYDVENLTSLLESARQISRALTVLLVLIALIALAISGIGIMNIMLVTVTERTHEIGIRKASGRIAQRNSLSILNGSFSNQRDRRASRNPHRYCNSQCDQSHSTGDPGSGRDSRSGVVDFGSASICGVVLDRCSIRLPASESGRPAESNGIAAI